MPHSQGSDPVIYRDPQFNFLAEANNIRQSGRYIDLHILTRNDEIVNAHKMVVAAIYRKLVQVLTNLDQRPLDLRRFDGQVVEALVNYAYTQTINISVDNVYEIFVLAAMLGRADVKGFCATFLTPRVTQENLFTVWACANAAKTRRMAEACLPLVVAHFDEILNDLAFWRCTRPEFLHFIIASPEIEDDCKKLRALECWYEGYLDPRSPSDNVTALRRLITSLRQLSVPSEIVSSIASKGVEINVPSEVLADFVRTWRERQRPQG